MLLALLVGALLGVLLHAQQIDGLRFALALTFGAVFFTLAAQFGEEA
jgi:hypothetical protein